MIRPTLRQLSFLVAIAEEKSFSRAAELCHVTQSTMSAGIKDLEEILGQPLVNRLGRTSTLTPLGEETVDSAKRLLDDIDAIVSRANQRQTPLSGILRLGVIPTIAPYMLPVILPELQTNYPHLDLQIHEDLTSRLLQHLDQGRLDAVLMAFPYETQGLETHILGEESFVLASPKSRKVPTTLNLGDLKPDDLLLLEDGHCMRDQALSACQLKVSNKRKTFSATSLPTLIQMVANGYGITLLPEMALNNLPANIQLTTFTNPLPTRLIGLSWKKNTPQKRDLLELHRILKILFENSMLP
jgi:LysR family transcriptional regulator, hydrogen peroxide-inducible genes activator